MVNAFRLEIPPPPPQTTTKKKIYEKKIQTDIPSFIDFSNKKTHDEEEDI